MDAVVGAGGMHGVVSHPVTGVEVVGGDNQFYWGAGVLPFVWKNPCLVGNKMKRDFPLRIFVKFRMPFISFSQE